MYCRTFLELIRFFFVRSNQISVYDTSFSLSLENMSSNKTKEENKADSNYETLVRSFTNRGKNKRKVKLVEDKLIQLTFADHEDSEDDEDFTLDDADLDSDDSNYGKIGFYHFLCILDMHNCCFECSVNFLSS